MQRSKIDVAAVVGDFDDEVPAEDDHGIRKIFDGAEGNLREKYSELKKRLELAEREGGLLKEVDVDQIDRSRFADRHPENLTREAVRDLMEDIVSVGQTTPVELRPTAAGRYEIVAGHRRVAACRFLGRPVVARILNDLADELMVVRMLSENKRTQISAYERGVHVRDVLLPVFGSHDRVAQALGVGRPYVTRLVSYASLSDELAGHLRLFEDVPVGTLDRIVSAVSDQTKKSVSKALSNVDGESGVERAESFLRAIAYKTKPAGLNLKREGYSLTLKRGGRGVAIDIDEGDPLAPTDLEDLAKAIDEWQRRRKSS